MNINRKTLLRAKWRRRSTAFLLRHEKLWAILQTIKATTHFALITMFALHTWALWAILPSFNIVGDIIRNIICLSILLIDIAVWGTLGIIYAYRREQGKH